MLLPILTHPVRDTLGNRRLWMPNIDRHECFVTTAGTAALIEGLRFRRYSMTSTSSPNSRPAACQRRRRRAARGSCQSGAVYEIGRLYTMRSGEHHFTAIKLHGGLQHPSCPGVNAQFRSSPSGYRARPKA